MCSGRVLRPCTLGLNEEPEALTNTLTQLRALEAPGAVVQFKDWDWYYDLADVLTEALPSLSHLKFDVPVIHELDSYGSGEGKTYIHAHIHTHMHLTVQHPRTGTTAAQPGRKQHCISFLAAVGRVLSAACLNATTATANSKNPCFCCFCQYLAHSFHSAHRAHPRLCAPCAPTNCRL